jgi:hypothetical protein
MKLEPSAQHVKDAIIAQGQVRPGHVGALPEIVANRGRLLGIAEEDVYDWAAACIQLMEAEGE